MKNTLRTRDLIINGTKTALLSLGFLALFTGGAAAQTYYYPQYNGYQGYGYYSYPSYPAYPSYTTTQCTTLSRDLVLGSRDSGTLNDVSLLQRFLVAQSYSGSGSWMITGYFGAATQAAVRTFQAQAGLYTSGYVDAQTRNAIQAKSCGSAYNYGYNNYNYNYQYTYPYNYNYNYNPCGNAGCYQGGVSLSYLSPNAGAVGSAVTVYGYGFSAEGNTVHFGNGIIANLRSPDGRSLSFTVPTQLTGYGVQPIQLMTYLISVSNQQGQTSNTVPFTVTGIANSGVRPSISSVSGPTSLAVNTTGTWSVTITAPTNSYVTMQSNWGDEYFYGYAAQQSTQSYYVNGTQTFTVTHAYQQPGNYTPVFTVSNQSGANSTSATVSVSY